MRISLAVVLALAALWAWETHLRSHGFRPYFDPRDKRLWSSQRERLGAEPATQVVFLGQSRMQAALDAEVFERLLPDHEHVQLALNGGYAIPMLRELLADGRFRGVIVYSIELTSNRGSQAEFSDYYRDEWNWAARFDAWFSIRLDERLATRAANYKPLAFLGRIVTGTPQKNAIPYDRPYRTDRANTYNAALPFWGPAVRGVQGATGKEVETFYGDLAAGKAWAQTFFADLAALEPAIREFQARGGRVVIVTLPTTNTVRPTYEADVKAVGWDHWVATTEATAIHFLDIDEMKALSTPDFSHLDREGASAFTAALIGELIERGAVDP